MAYGHPVKQLSLTAAGLASEQWLAWPIPRDKFYKLCGYMRYVQSYTSAQNSDRSADYIAAYR